MARENETTSGSQGWHLEAQKRTLGLGRLSVGYGYADGQLNTPTGSPRPGSGFFEGEATPDWNKDVGDGEKNFLLTVLAVRFCLGSSDCNPKNRSPAREPERTPLPLRN